MGGQGGEYSHHDNPGVHHSLVRVLCAGEIPSQEDECGGIWCDWADDREEVGNPGDGVEAVVEDLCHHVDGHFGGVMVCELMGMGRS